MSVLIKRTLFFSTLLLAFNVTHAGPPGPPGPKPDLPKLAESCSKAAIQIDWLGRYQDRAACTSNLNGLNVYIASQYILANQLSSAQPLINTAIIQTNYAIAIGCYGIPSMQAVVVSLQSIQDAIS